MMAVDEANAAGGVLGKKIRVQLEDDGSKPDQAATAVTKLINSDNVLAIIGEVSSSRSLAAAPICQAAGVPMMSPASTNPAVTQKGDYIFRACYIDPVQGPVIARLGKQDLKANTAAILKDIKNAYSVGLAEEISKEFQKGGGEIVAEESFGEGDKDFRAQLTKIKNTRPDVVFVPAYYSEVGLIARQMRSLGMKQPILGGDGIESPKLIQIGGAAVNNTMFTTHFSSESTDPLARKFVTGYRQRYGVTPDGLTAVGYDAARLTIDAIKRAGSTDRAKIRDAMAATKDFPGVSGKITLNAERNAVKPLAVMKVENGKYVYVKTVSQ
jgi:branched-chain amino acid transport system substrate-binding protein